MKMKAGDLMRAAAVLTEIINRKPAMPQRGKYLLARLHAKLAPEYVLLDTRRDEMIKAYETPQVGPVSNTAEDGTVTVTMEEVPGKFMVPPDKMPEYVAAWTTIADEEIEVDVQPIPLSAISLPNGSDGAIEAGELITLGDLVYDNAA